MNKNKTMKVAVSRELTFFFFACENDLKILAELIYNRQHKMMITTYNIYENIINLGYTYGFGSVVFK